MEDFFKNLKGDSLFNVENPTVESKNDESNLLVQNKAEENTNVLQQKDEPVHNPIKNMDLVTPDGSGAPDKIKEVKDEKKANEEIKTPSKSKIDESNMLVQNKAPENVNIVPVQIDEPVYNPIKTMDLVTPEGSGMQEKIKDVKDENNTALEELKKKSMPDSNLDNPLLATTSAETLKRMSSTPPDVREINEKLTEISLQSQAALEDLKTQSTRIIDHAKSQTNKVLENAKLNFSVFTRALEQELEQQTPKPPVEVDIDPPKSAEATFDELVERYSRSDNIMDFFN
ncbi:probable serine/threonine-protein kinase kinX isoform X1 [Helicoverpa armigera]|uniref:probable serine/threonine-protein kinase kinX isoform X1 n=1 Tax=Helicoverpa armigera TaxID=29058 RepID=UPI003083EBA8